MGLFNKSKTEQKIDRLYSIWDSAVDGVSVEIEEEAFMLLQDIIAEKPSNDAKKMLADCYLFGIGCNENLLAAKQLYTEVSHDPNYSIANKILGDLYYNDKNDLAFLCYTKYLATNPTDYEAYSNLATCYYKGLGANTDITTAMQMYKRVSSTDYANTTTFQIRYGNALDEQECAESIIWLSKAANNDSWASYCLASVFKDARYLPFDIYSPEYRIKSALYYYENAFNMASAENDTEIADLAKDAYNIFKAELNANAFAFYFKSADGTEVAFRCQMNV